MASTEWVPGSAGAPGSEYGDPFRAHREGSGPSDERGGIVAVEHVGGADEVGDEAVCGVLVYVARLANLLDASRVEHRKPVAQRQRLILVVGDDDERDTHLALYRLELQLHSLPQLEVERAERFVEQQHARPPDERTGQCDALTLPARQLRRPPRCLIGEAHQVEGVGSASAALGLRDASDLHAVLDVLRHRHVRKQCVLLEHGVDVPEAGGQPGDVHAAEPDDAGGGLFESGDHAQHGGLARPRRAQDGEEFTIVDGQVGVVHRDYVSASFGEHLAHADEFDLRAGRLRGRVERARRAAGSEGHG